MRLLILLLLIGALSLVNGAGPSRNTGTNTLSAVLAKPLEEIVYRGYIVMDAPSVKHYGGKEAVQQKLDAFFQNVTHYWNESGKDKKGSNRFKKRFIFTGKLMDTYEGSSTEAGKNNKLAKNVDLSSFDFFVLFDMLKDHEDEKGGAYCGQVRDDGLAGVTQKVGEDKYGDFFTEKERFRTMVHELGHYRMVTDVYATMCQNKEKGNPVNGEEFVPMECIMHNGHCGYWSDYAVNIINKAAIHKIPGSTLKNFFEELFCKEIHINITLNGSPPKEGEVIAKFYGKVANPGDNEGRYITPPAYTVIPTNAKGNITLTDIKNLYCHPGKWEGGKIPEGTKLGWGRWFNLLVVFEDKEEKALGHIWIPEYEAQTHGRNEAILTLPVSLEK